MCYQFSKNWYQSLQNLYDRYMLKYMPKVTTMEMNKTKDGVTSLNYPMLTRENYTSWSMKTKVFMQASGVWIAIEPKDEKATVEDKVDKLALAVIYQSIPEDVLLSIADKVSAKEAWDAVKIMNQGADKVKKAKMQTL